MTSARKKLQDLERLGDHLFHGSGYKTDILRPYQAYNFIEGENIPDDKPGVHATSNMDIAIFMAIFSKPNVPDGLHSSFGYSGDNITFSASKQTLNQLHSGAKGYVYVLKKKEFTQRTRFEYITYQSIKPVQIIQVTEKDLPENINPF